MDRQQFWMKDPELKAAYEALGPNFRREVEQAQARRGQRTLQGAAIASRSRSSRPHQPHPGSTARR